MAWSLEGTRENPWIDQGITLAPVLRKRNTFGICPNSLQMSKPINNVHQASRGHLNGISSIRQVQQPPSVGARGGPVGMAF